MLSKRFPFGVYYEVEDDVVYVCDFGSGETLWIRKHLREKIDKRQDALVNLWL